MTLTKRKFGHALRHEFLLEDGYVPMNHGSYGVCPKSVQAVRHEWQLKAEQNPDRFLKFTLWPELDKIRERLSHLVHCDRDELVFVVNASFGINSVVRSLSLKQGEKVLVVSMAIIHLKNESCMNDIETSSSIRYTMQWIAPWCICKTHAMSSLS